MRPTGGQITSPQVNWTIRLTVITSAADDINTASQLWPLTQSSFLPLTKRGLIGSRLTCRQLIMALSFPLFNNWLIFTLCIVDSAAASSKWLWVTSWWPGSTYCGTNCACRTPALRGRRTMTSSWRRTPPSWRALTLSTCSISSPCTHSWDRWTLTLRSTSTQ